MNIYSLYNKTTNFFNRPFYCESDEEAITYLQNVLMSDGDRALTGLKGDLDLYFLGTIDFVTGFIEPDKFIVTSLDWIFDTIPTEKLKPGVTLERFEELEKKYHDLLAKINNHKHTRKEGIYYES